MYVGVDLRIALSGKRVGNLRRQFNPCKAWALLSDDICYQRDYRVDYSNDPLARFPESDRLKRIGHRHCVSRHLRIL